MKFKENREHIEGRIYQHNLTIKQVQNQSSENYGKDFISGNLEIAVDEEGLNVIPVHFMYVTEVTNSGKKNATYSILKKIIDEGKTWVTDGKENAMKVSVNTALALNDFYTQNDELVSVKVNEGGFVSFVNELAEEKERNKFYLDIVITGVTRVEADEEKHIEQPYAVVRGAVFNYRGALLPVELVVKDPGGMQYFENKGVTNAQPLYTKVWGNINCETKTTVVKEESAFGEAAVRTYERKTKEWVIVGSNPEGYDFGDPEVLTAEELTKALQDREVMLAGVKQRNDEYKAQKAAGNVNQNAVKQGTFNF